MKDSVYVCKTISLSVYVDITFSLWGVRSICVWTEKRICGHDIFLYFLVNQRWYKLITNKSIIKNSACQKPTSPPS